MGEGVVPSVMEYPIVQIYDFQFQTKTFGKDYSYKDISILMKNFLRIDSWNFKKESDRYVYYFHNSNRFNRIITLLIDKKKVNDKIHLNYAFSRRGYLEHSLIETISIQNKLITSSAKVPTDPTTFIKTIKKYLLNEVVASDPCDPTTYDPDACHGASATSGAYDPSSTFSDDIDKITEKYERKARKAKKEWEEADKVKALWPHLGNCCSRFCRSYGKYLSGLFI